MTLALTLAASLIGLVIAMALIIFHTVPVQHDPSEEIE